MLGGAWGIGWHDEKQANGCFSGYLRRYTKEDENFLDQLLLAMKREIAFHARIEEAKHSVETSGFTCDKKEFRSMPLLGKRC
ncbi:hypothetical protein TNCT_652581 [Trichonephila clavata]|uniref:Uncharacterized protein n=1 Tax=Trichonephila clavata TaxID=2740835 RepID=A0A8X6HAR2_TRICU|nr:hypothetical protein TNCT_652581 [Trichonephila clavata]